MIQRKYIEEIKFWLQKEKIIILKWARQVGKTTLMKKIEQYIQQENLWKTLFLFADKIDNQNIFSTPDNFLNYLKYNYNFPNEYIFVFIDEFQFINNTGTFLKNIFDEYKDRLQIIVSGSSSLEISKNSEFLTGRAIDFYIDRISFREFFIYRHNLTHIPVFEMSQHDELKSFYALFKQKLEHDFISYLTYGWYPEIVVNKENKSKELILSQIIETYIQKDIIHFLKIENIGAFNNLIKLLASNIWNLVNINEISSTLNISVQTVNKYLDILEWTFVFSRISPFFKNIRKELSKMPKIYIEDIWIKNYSLRQFDSITKKIDLWSEVENFVYNELTKQFEKKQIYFYRTVSKAEIDFVIEKSFEKYILIEVKYRNKKIPVPVIMRNFEESYGKHQKIIITKEYLSQEDDLYYIPAVLLPFMKI